MSDSANVQAGVNRAASGWGMISREKFCKLLASPQGLAELRNLAEFHSLFIPAEEPPAPLPDDLTGVTLDEMTQYLEQGFTDNPARRDLVERFYRELFPNEPLPGTDVSTKLVSGGDQETKLVIENPPRPAESS